MSGEVADLAATVAASTTAGGQYGIYGMAAAAVVGGVVFLRQYLSKGAADRADDAGRVSAIGVYKEMLDSERAARAASDQRADMFAKERNDAITALGAMKGQLEASAARLEAATQQLSEATRELKEASEEIVRLRRVIEINGAPKQ